ncbi:tetratricopeptide repeat protein [Ichthyenterobacterium sp. W332]|uniref:Tetratricopeptide repeat protein n=1 Tax=Microcosmobacter mediterraneus TaxID=3075607 RepID=A0ABU2YHL0_9FLAO|nr:tetratricopeptide repeat protein [Ichthyenterobacterium sp. W332]MDT0557381.1 tetratricopeptide repeat protein [Ichthyenterobacterium sp. W332]
MKSKVSFILITVTMISFSCSKNINYSEQFKSETAGRYLYHADDIIDIYYEDNTLMLRWREGKIKPVVLDENTFFVSDMYKKLEFTKHLETNKRYLSIVPENAEKSSTYDYLKVDSNYKTPSMHLKDKNYQKAFEGYLAIKQQDSTSELINEWEFNRIGYDFMRQKDYENALGIFKMNAALFPTSDNVYDSLADAYLRSGDSINAYENYVKALDLNSRNKRAEKFIENYKVKVD